MRTRRRFKILNPRGYRCDRNGAAAGNIKYLDTFKSYCGIRPKDTPDHCAGVIRGVVYNVRNVAVIRRGCGNTAAPQIGRNYGVLSVRHPQPVRFRCVLVNLYGWSYPAMINLTHNTLLCYSFN